MPTQYLRVKVDCETELEEEAELRQWKQGERYFNANGRLVYAACDAYPLSEPRLIVTPKKEPEVSEAYTIPVEVPKELYEKYASGIWKRPVPGDTIASQHYGTSPATPKEADLKYIVLTPRFVYPPELMSPKVWGIAIDSGGQCRMFMDREPHPGTRGWCSKSDAPFSIDEETIRALFPNIALPTLSDAGGNWREARWMNPDFGKGE